ncbi:acyl carrier protein, partial [Streptomyces sp. NPDC001856]
MSITALADMAPADTALAGAAPARSATTVTTAGPHRAHPAAHATQAEAAPADATPAHSAPAHATLAHAAPANTAPAAPAADGGPHPSGDRAPAPTGPLDTLRHLVAQVLGMPADAVHPGHGFTELGGDSIQAIQVVSRARAAGLLVTTRDVLRSESVGALAAASRAADG